ncbi:AarF/UbiB family protein [Amycolatopsis sp. NPDC051071]|uniref:ABC1 kinase family protein n=1 Tax=Amycolatopsis sp. NPDC051071 TaxID=3154637 RepID=UPI003444A106
MAEHRLRAVVTALVSLLGSQVRYNISRDRNFSSERGSPAQRRAREVRLTLERLGPFYIKVGQMLSTRPDIVSETTIAELRKLHDTVSIQPFSVFEPVLRCELGDRWRNRFGEFDTDHALAAASLAQVHACTLPDGRPAVAKIQRPGIASLIGKDMALLRRAAWLLSRAAPGFTEVIDVHAMLGSLFEAMRSELDFTAEARHMNRARGEIADFKHLDIPEVLLVTPRVMIQSRAPGRSIRDADPAEFTAGERLGIGRDLLAFMYRSYFTTRVFHADPHPGNIFVHPGEKAHLLDWGMVGSIDRNVSRGILQVLTNIALNDGAGLAQAWLDLGRSTIRADVSAFQNDMEAFVPRVTGASLEDLNFGVTLTTILASATRNGIYTNPAVATLGKSFANLEGSIRYLAPELSIIDIFHDELSDVMIDLIEDTLSEPQFARTLLELISAINGVPQRLHSILRDLSNGQLKMQVNQLPRIMSSGIKRKFILGAAVTWYWWRKRSSTAQISNRSPGTP